MSNRDRGTTKEHRTGIAVEGHPIDVSENIFADLGLKDAEEYNAKVQLALAIRRLIREHGTMQKAAAAQAGVKQSDFSNIVNGRLDGISMERLTHVLNHLGQDVEISVHPKRAERARTYVSTNGIDIGEPTTASGREE
jgi:predicted XRE-type DNA-binding protein